MKWSPANGLVNRETNQPISKDPDEIAKTLIGPNASRADMDSVETINKAKKQDLIIMIWLRMRKIIFKNRDYLCQSQKEYLKESI